MTPRPNDDPSLMYLSDDSSDTRDMVDIMMITTGGTVLYGSLPTNQLSPDVYPEYRLQPFGKRSPLLIPSTKVAGIRPLTVQQKSISDENEISSLPPLIQQLKKATIERADEVEYINTVDEVSPVGKHYGAPVPDFNWNDIEFTDDTPLYCDWNYLTRKEGGLESLGAGALGFSLSAGWNESLWSSFNDIIENKQVQIGEEPGKSEVTLSGYIGLLSIDDNYVTKNMEGEDWIGGIISNEIIDGIDQFEDSNLSIVMFRKDSFMFPIDLWSDINNEVSVYGDVMNVSFNTGFSEADCFIKARAAAYIGKQ